MLLNHNDVLLNELVPDDKIEVSEDDEPLVVKKKDEQGEQLIEEVEREE